MGLAKMANMAKLTRSAADPTPSGSGRVAIPPRSRVAGRSEPAVDHVGVNPAELIRIRAEQSTYMELVTKEDNVPPGAFAMHDHLLRVLDRALRGTCHRNEVEELLCAADEFEQWRQDKGCKLSASAEAIRNRAVDALHRLAGPLPADPSRAAVSDEHVVGSMKAMTMTVEAFAHAIGKSPRTVYRMACNGQVSMYREGAGRGTVLIYRDQVDPANRPHVAHDS